MGVDEAWWLPWSSKPVRPDSVGLGGFDSHALPPTRGVSHQVITANRQHGLAAAVLALNLLFATGRSLHAQQPRPDSARRESARPDSARGAAPRRDTTTTAVDTVGPSPELRPPLSPRRAFLYSLILPGYAQSVLGRNRAGALEMAFEAVALTMIRISAADVREARRMVADSIPVSFVDDAGVPRIRYQRTPFPESLIRARRAHLEDWIAVLIGNHLFSAADAFVAANLWDLPAEVSVRASPGSAGVALSVPW